MESSIERVVRAKIEETAISVLRNPKTQLMIESKCAEVVDRYLSNFDFNHFVSSTVARIMTQEALETVRVRIRQALDEKLNEHLERIVTSVIDSDVRGVVEETLLAYHRRVREKLDAMDSNDY